jgi:hypothetical protein
LPPAYGRNHGSPARPSGSVAINFVAAATVVFAAARLVGPAVDFLAGRSDARPPTATRYSVAGTIFRDLDGDVEYTAGESGEPGWRVYLDVNCNGRYDLGTDPVTTTRLADAGPGRPAASYEFEGIAPGTHCFRGWHTVRLVEGQPHPRNPAYRPGPDRASWPRRVPGSGPPGCLLNVAHYRQAPREDEYGEEPATAIYSDAVPEPFPGPVPQAVP